MKSAWLLIGILAGSLWAQEAVSTRYKVMLSLFGKVGEATITVAERGDRYVMVVEAAATGLAANISGNERDCFVSRGHIEEGYYVSDTFEEYQVSSKRRESNVFIFDHDAKTVTRYQDKNETVHESRFDFDRMGVVDKTFQKIERREIVLPFYSPNDALSISLNFPKMLEKADSVEIKPVGLAKEERKMLISRPDPALLPEYLENFHYPTVTKVIVLDDYELASDDSYGVLMGYNAHGGVDEVTTKETYFLIGYGRIEKIGETKSDTQAWFERDYTLY